MHALAYFLYHKISILRQLPAFHTLRSPFLIRSSSEIFAEMPMSGILAQVNILDILRLLTEKISW
jgi:hypothetical protein